MPRLRPPPGLKRPTNLLALLELVEVSSLSAEAKAAGRMLILNQMILARIRLGPFAPRRRRKINDLEAAAEMPRFDDTGIEYR
jgi:hypothetical protein